MYDFGFIVEQSLGHLTHGLNLQEHIARDPAIRADWGLPAWRREGWAGKLPGLRSNWTLQDGLQTRGLLRDLRLPAKKKKPI